MRKITIAAIALLAVVAWAGENRYLGRILSSGTPVTNVSTLFPFPIPPGSKVTMYCNAAVNVLTDSRTVNAIYDGGTVVCGSPTGLCAQPYGMPIPATTLMPTSVGRALTTSTAATWVFDSGIFSDGGVIDGGFWAPVTYSLGEQSALIAMQPANPLDAGWCDVWQRMGGE